MRLRAIVHWGKILLMCRDCDCMQSIRCHQNWNQKGKKKEKKQEVALTLLWVVEPGQERAFQGLCKLPCPFRGLDEPSQGFFQNLVFDQQDPSKQHPYRNVCFRFPLLSEQLPEQVQVQQALMPSLESNISTIESSRNLRSDWFAISTSRERRMIYY